MTAGQVFRLPDLGEGLTEAEILDWKVSVGDTVEIDQIVVEVETAKAAVEVPVPYAGTVLALHAEPGAVLSVGAPLIEVAAEHPAAARYRDEERAGSGNVLIGYGTTPTPPRRRHTRPTTNANATTAPRSTADLTTTTNLTPATNLRPAADRRPATDSRPTTDRRPAADLRPAAESHPAAEPSPATNLRPAADRRPATDPRPADLRPAAESRPVAEVRRREAAGGMAPRVISPLVRRIAREHGIDLDEVTPTGPRAVILRRDVDRAITDRARATAGRAPVADRSQTTAGRGPVADRSQDAAGQERVPLRGVRRAVAEKLSRSRAEIPDATTWVDVDATELLAARDALRRDRPDLGIGLLALLARICVDGLRRFPELNSTVDVARSEIVRYGHVNLGFAAQTDRGLVVPVVRGAHRMTTAQLAGELTRLTGLARTGKLPPEALTGGTFTLNNYGVFGVDGSTPIINHPEAALLGVGRVIDRPWVHGGAVVPRKITQLSLTFDHRVCDGGAAGGFLRHVADLVENPAILLAHV
ncbi:dihydrolipoamide acetyltransferase family protein [Nonomuraea ferruginea]|uniref:Dihydrolipoamide acetyltransferase component of pyruvate dehydrogenase complex n=1 Tax=Nonomuraea ferruginea TaxID=46174 RepID=A0ABT4T974_9ACTN|nr:dihydrolipoamide acetyltransferase family protein [Nonomuraea ferruginea]MDA0646057.1 dihydrolipoamide acetyltransferase family protein [Nonomuraea ferruginea]